MDYSQLTWKQLQHIFKHASFNSDVKCLIQGYNNAQQTGSMTKKTWIIFIGEIYNTEFLEYETENFSEMMGYIAQGN